MRFVKRQTSWAASHAIFPIESVVARKHQLGLDATGIFQSECKQHVNRATGGSILYSILKKERLLSVWTGNGCVSAHVWLCARMCDASEPPNSCPGMRF